MAVQEAVVLPQRVCGSERYKAVFWVCTHCDRGQRYCFAVCRERRAANRRHLARPAEFLVDGSGKIQWVNLTETILARLKPETVIGVLDRMASPATR
jgi:hypothetical protein